MYLVSIETICDLALDPFDEGERERIIRWASERLGINKQYLASTPGARKILTIRDNQVMKLEDR